MKNIILNTIQKTIQYSRQILLILLYILQYTMIGIEYIARQSNKILDKIILILQKNECDSGEDEQFEVNKHGFPFFFGKK